MTYIVPSKPLKDVIFDLDDFSQQPGNNCIATLIKLKENYPKLKVTLFAIPFHKRKSNKKFLRNIIENFGDWIQLGIHGWTHEKGEEFNYGRTLFSYDWGCFRKLYKAPCWKLTKKTSNELNKMDFIIAEHGTNLGKKSYKLSHPWCVHGHTWNLNNPDPRYNNGIQQIIERGVPWDKNTNFHWITEAYDK